VVTPAARPDEVRGLQELAARAQPADHVERLDGGWLRHTSGGAWWVGSALPHGDAGPGELARRVARAEAFYAASGAPARFQITPGVCPGPLDGLLADRGYHRRTPMSLQVAPTAVVVERAGAAGDGARRGPAAEVDDRPGTSWVDAWRAVHGPHGDPPAERDRLAGTGAPCAYASVWVDGEVAAVGRAVADGGWAGVFGMGTRPEARGRGAARSVLTALATWAADLGAGRLYLQVEGDNAPALRLYGGAGFAELSGYHYRVAE
jgi:ribosomal protein S18 acetylase RimI-like enzyme